jgi:hypothetical protein
VFPSARRDEDASVRERAAHAAKATLRLGIVMLLSTSAATLTARWLLSLT